MFKAYHNKINNISHNLNDEVMAVVFMNETINFYSTELEYKIVTSKPLSKYLDSEVFYNAEDVFSHRFISLQICVDESFLKMKLNDSFFNLKVGNYQIIQFLNL